MTITRVDRNHYGHRPFEWNNGVAVLWVRLSVLSGSFPPPYTIAPVLTHMDQRYDPALYAVNDGDEFELYRGLHIECRQIHTACEETYALLLMIGATKPEHRYGPLPEAVAGQLVALRTQYRAEIDALEALNRRAFGKEQDKYGK